MQNIMKAIKAWDEKNTNFHSLTYMGIFIAASATFLSSFHQAAAAAGLM